MERRKLGILISGRGSNMAALVEASRSPDCPYEVALVASDRPEAPGLEWAQANGVSAVGLPTPTRKDKSQYEAALDLQLRQAGVEAIALAGYMRLLSDDFVARWRDRIVNIHPSLLPKYKGLDTHARALAMGDVEAGCTVHIVTEELDAGEILGQASVRIEARDTAETLAEKVLIEEHRLYPRVISEWLNQLPR